MDNLKKLVLLHSNDMHGDFLTETINEDLVGGVSYLSGYVNKIRQEEDNTLYCVAGDMFRGSIIDSEFKGLSTIEIMNMLSPDVVTIGNHEVDYGLAHLLFLEKCAKFPIINANMYIKSNNARLFRPHRIVEIDGMRVLFIGILTEEVLASTKSEELIGTFIDCVDAAKEVGKICNSYNAIDIDLTVLLTHIGFEEDKKLAAMLDPAWGVDIIIGGHSHTLPEKPEFVNGIAIVQAGTGTDQIGRFDLLVDTENNCIHSYEWKIIDINPVNCVRDRAMEKVIRDYKKHTDEKYGRIITRLERKLTHPDRYQETEVGNLTADILQDSLGVDVMLVGSGSLRRTAFGPIITYQEFMEMYAYDDPIYMIKVTGKKLKEMILYMCRDETWAGKHTEFYQFSTGLKVTYSKARHCFDRFDFEDEPIDEDRIFTVALQGYHYINAEDCFNITEEEIAEHGKARIIATSGNEILEEFLTENQLICSEVEGRLIIMEK